MTENTIQLEHADEAKAMLLSEPEQFSDAQHFIINYGIILSQMREGIKGAYLTDDQIVHIMYKDGTEKQISVDGDSYHAMIYDIIIRI